MSSAIALTDTASLQAEGEPTEALYFDSGGQGLFGWVHRPTGATATNIGLVLCNPFGYEELCAHRSLRAFAEEAAACGVFALRFDYLGTGDSSEIDPKADQIEAWTRDIIAAVAELRRRTGVERVCLLGLRLGALLAIKAAQQCAAVHSLVLIAPVINGRRHLRELRMTRLASSLHSAVTTAPGGHWEVSGFPLSAASIAALTEVDLSTPRLTGLTRALIIDGNSLPAAGEWASTLRSLGVRTHYLALPGLTEMAMTAAQFARVPEAMIASLHDWLSELTHESAPHHRPFSVTHFAANQVKGSHIAGAQKELTLASDGAEPQVSVTERPTFIDPEGLLFGIVTEPPRGEMRRRAVILLNSGADHHIGPNRMHVDLARRWARRGYLVVRLDLMGLGDSRTRPGRQANEVFPPDVLDDIRAAVDFIRNEYGAGDIALAGLCSGAYHALRAAVAGIPINRILMINPLNFFWKQGKSLHDLQVAEVVRNPGVYRQQLFSVSAWRRVLTGQVNLWRITKIYFHRQRLELISKLRDVARRLHMRLPQDLGWDLEDIAAKGIRVVFVFSRSDPGLDLLKIEGGSSVKRLGDRCRVYQVDQADHVFSHSGPRAAMEKILSDELFARPEYQQSTAPGP